MDFLPPNQNDLIMIKQSHQAFDEDEVSAPEQGGEDASGGAHIHCLALCCLQVRVVLMLKDAVNGENDVGVDAQLPNLTFRPLQHPCSSPWSPLLCEA